MSNGLASLLRNPRRLQQFAETPGNYPAALSFAGVGQSRVAGRAAPRTSKSEEETGVLETGEVIDKVKLPDGSYVAPATQSGQIVKVPGRSNLFVDPATGEPFQADPAKPTGLRSAFEAARKVARGGKLFAVVPGVGERELGADPEAEKKAKEQAAKREAENLRLQYAQEKRPYNWDRVAGRPVPVQSDEEWAKAKQEKADKLAEAAAVKKLKAQADKLDIDADRLSLTTPKVSPEEAAAYDAAVSSLESFAAGKDLDTAAEELANAPDSEDEDQNAAKATAQSYLSLRDKVKPAKDAEAKAKELKLRALDLKEQMLDPDAWKAGKAASLAELPDADLAAEAKAQADIITEQETEAKGTLELVAKGRADLEQKHAAFMAERQAAEAQGLSLEQKQALDDQQAQLEAEMADYDDWNAEAVTSAQGSLKASQDRREVLAAAGAEMDRRNKAATEQFQAQAEKAAVLEKAKPLYDWAKDNFHYTDDYRGMEDYGILDAEAKKRGIDPAQAREALQYFRQLDWSNEHRDPGTGKPLDETARLLPDGNVTVNPALLLDPEAYDAAVDATETTPEAKKRAKLMRADLAEPVAAEAIKNLRKNSDFAAWLDENTSGTDLERMEKFNAEMKAGGALNAALMKFFGSAASLPSGWLGAVAGLTGSDKALEYARYWQDRAQAYQTAAGEAGKGTNMAGRFMASVAGGLPSVMESMAVGGVAGRVLGSGAAALGTAAVDAAAQSGGGTFVEAVDAYMQQGLPEEEAKAKAAAPALASGLVTGVLTALGGGGVESLLRRDGQELAKAAIKRGLKSMIGREVAEGATEESFEEWADQMLQGVIAQLSYDPGKSLEQVFTEATEAGLVGGVLGGGASGIRAFANRNAPTSAAQFAPAPGPVPAKASAPAMPTQPRAAVQGNVGKIIAAFTPSGVPMPQAVNDTIKRTGRAPDQVAKAAVSGLTKVAQGATLEGLDAREREALGFINKDGKIVPAPKTTPLVEIYKDKLVIRNEAAEWLDDEGQPALARQIKLDEAARKAQIDEAAAKPASKRPPEVEAWDWTEKNKVRRKVTDEWFEGGMANADVNAAFERALQYGGENLATHGMAKFGTLSQAYDSLMSILTRGIDPKKGRGKLDVAPLVVPRESAAAMAGTTAGGTSYRDGPFILVSRKQAAIADSADVHAILVNDANAGQIDAIRKAIHGVRPDIIVELYSKADEVARQLNQPAKKKAGQAAPKAAESTPQARLPAKSAGSLPAEKGSTPLPATTQPTPANDQGPPAPAPQAAPEPEPAAGGGLTPVKAYAEMTPAEYKAKRKQMSDPATWSPAVAEFEHKGMIAHAIKNGLPFSQEAAKEYGIKAMTPAQAAKATPEQKARAAVPAAEVQPPAKPAAVDEAAQEAATSPASPAPEAVTEQGDGVPKPNNTPAFNRFVSDLDFYGTANFEGSQFTVKQASDETFYVEKTTNGERTVISSSFSDLEGARKSAVESARQLSAEASSVRQSAPTIESKPEERGASVEAIASGGGMSVEEARRFLNRKSDTGEPLVFGRPWSEISGMQHQQRPPVLRSVDKFKAVKQIISGINKFKIPVAASVADAYGINLPEGYTREGDLYVYRPAPAGQPVSQAGQAVSKPVPATPLAKAKAAIADYTLKAQGEREAAKGTPAEKLAVRKMAAANLLLKRLTAFDGVVDYKIETEYEGKPTGGMQIAMDGSFIINPDKILNQVAAPLLNQEGIRNAIDKFIVHEFIHKAALLQISDSKIKRLYNSLTREAKEASRKLYLAESPGETLNDFQAAHEWFAQLVEARMSGEISNQGLIEASADPDFRDKLAALFREFVAKLREIAGIVKDPAMAEQIRAEADAVEAAVRQMAEKAGLAERQAPAPAQPAEQDAQAGPEEAPAPPASVTPAQAAAVAEEAAMPEPAAEAEKPKAGTEVEYRELGTSNGEANTTVFFKAPGFQGETNMRTKSRFSKEIMLTRYEYDPKSKYGARKTVNVHGFGPYTSVKDAKAVLEKAWAAGRLKFNELGQLVKMEPGVSDATEINNLPAPAGGWSGRKTGATADFISDGRMLIPRAKVRSLSVVNKPNARTKEGETAGMDERAAKLWQDITSTETKNLRVMQPIGAALTDDGMKRAYFQTIQGNTVTLDAGVLGVFMKALGKIDKWEVTFENNRVGPVIAYRGGEPVGVIMPLSGLQSDGDMARLVEQALARPAPPVTAQARPSMAKQVQQAAGAGFTETSLPKAKPAFRVRTLKSGERVIEKFDGKDKGWTRQLALRKGEQDDAWIQQWVAERNGFVMPVDEEAKPAEPPAEAPASQEPAQAAGPAEGVAAVTGYDSLRAFINNLRDGEVTAEQVRTAWAQLKAARPAILADLNKMKVDDLLPMAGISARKADGKAAIAKSVVDMLESYFNPDGTISYSFGRDMQANKDAAMDEKVAKWTDEMIVDQARARREDAEARKAAREKALTNPETKDEWDRFVFAKGRQALTPEEIQAIKKMKSGRNEAVIRKGESLLTSEQLAAYDAVRGIDRKAAEQARTEAKARVYGVTTGVEADIVETKHTQKGHDLFVVKLSERVERPVYDRLNAAAKKLGGHYSFYSKGGAVPGFQFTSRAAAENFIAVSKGETVDQKEQIQERQEAKKSATASRLNALADGLDAKAEGILSADRKTNTVKRAREAAGQEANALKMQAMAQTMRNLAAAMESGEATHLDGVTAGTHVDTLDGMARAAMQRWSSAKNLGYTERQKAEAEGPTAEMMDAARIPYPYIDKSTILNMVEAGRKTPGAKLLAERVAKIQMNEDDGQAVTLRRDDDLENVKELAQKVYDRGRLFWDGIKWKYETYDRLKAMGLTNLPSLRAALREYLQYRGKAAKADPVKAMERELIGMKLPGFFPTPRPIIDEMIGLAGIRPGMTVLEPSAGKGDIAEAVQEAGAEVETFETQSRLRDILNAKGIYVRGHDFMDMQPREAFTFGDTFRAPDGYEGIMRGLGGMGSDRVRLVGPEGERSSRYYSRSELTPVKKNGDGYDAVVMNPPFENGQDIEHVQHAYKFLKEGGTLVAVMSAGPFYRQDKQATAFREWLDEQNSTYEAMPEGSFAGADAFRQTGVRTYLVTIRKPYSSMPKMADESQAGPGLAMPPAGQAVTPGQDAELEVAANEAVREAGEILRELQQQGEQEAREKAKDVAARLALANDPKAVRAIGDGEKIDARNPSLIFKNPAARRFYQAILVARAELGMRTYISDKELQDFARKQFDSDPEGVYEWALDKADEGESLNDEEQAVLFELFDRAQADDSPFINRPGFDQEMVKLGHYIRESRGTTGRMLRYGRDRVETPQQRWKRAFYHIKGPDSKQAAMLRIAPSAREKARRIAELEDQLSKASAARRADIEAALAKAKRQKSRAEVLEEITAENERLMDTIIDKMGGVTRDDIMHSPLERYGAQIAVLDLPAVREALDKFDNGRDIMLLSFRGFSTQHIAGALQIPEGDVADFIKQANAAIVRPAITEQAKAGKTFGDWIKSGLDILARKTGLRQPPSIRPLENWRTLITGKRQTLDEVTAEVNRVMNYVQQSQKARDSKKLMSKVINTPTGQRVRIFVPFDPDDATNYYSFAREYSAAKANVFDKFYEYWINWPLLSGPQTQVVNFTGNAAQVAWHYTGQRLAEATLNALIYHDPNSAQLREFWSIIKGFWKSIGPALDMARQSFLTEGDTVRHKFLNEPLQIDIVDGDLDKVGGIRAAVGGKMGRLNRLPGRVLRWTDSFFKTAVLYAEASAVAYRKAHASAKAQGLKGQARRDFIDTEIDNTLKDPQSPVWADVMDTAEELLFQDDNVATAIVDTMLGGYRGVNAFEKALAEAKASGNSKTVAVLNAMIAGAKAVNRIMRFIFPFQRTPTNIIRVGLRKGGGSAIVGLYHLLHGGWLKYKDGTPMLESYTKAMQIKDLSETGIAVLGWLMLSSMFEGDDDDEKKPFLIVGSRSSSRQGYPEKQAFLNKYGGESSFVWQDEKGNVIASKSFGRYEPVGTLLTTWVDAYRNFQEVRRRQKAGEAASFKTYMLSSFVSGLENKSFLQGLSNVMEWVRDIEERRENPDVDANTKLFLRNVVPNIIKQPLRNWDEFVRESKTAGAGYSALPNPAAAPKLPTFAAEPKISTTGQKMRKDLSAPARLLFPANTIVTPQPDALLYRANRLNPAAAKWPSGIQRDEFFYRAPGAKPKTPGYHVPIEDAAGKRRFAEMVGQEYTKEVRKYVASLPPALKAKPGPEQIEGLAKAMTEARKKARILYGLQKPQTPAITTSNK